MTIAKSSITGKICTAHNKHQSLLVHALFYVHSANAAYCKVTRAAASCQLAALSTLLTVPKNTTQQSGMVQVKATRKCAARAAQHACQQWH